MMLQGLKAELNRLEVCQPFGYVHSIAGGLLRVTGLEQIVAIGALCQLKARNGTMIACEVVGFEAQLTLVMAYSPLEGIGPGCQVNYVGGMPTVYPHMAWLGRVVNGFAEAVDQAGALPLGGEGYDLMALPITAHKRATLGPRLDLGVKALNTFTTCCLGQRLGIFAGSGVGKSVLMSQLAKFSSADVIVIGLIGERGREVKEFIEEFLGEEGLKRSVIVVATSDEPALMRRRAAYTALAIAEYFRDQGAQVLCLMDSMTRFAMALREIGLAVGEPPTTKGYTPNVFVELPRLLERAGPGPEEPKSGTVTHITGLFTVLVEGDDHNEPIADTVRGILDGHVVLERKIAERGRFPAINVLRSISRMMPGCNYSDETEMIQKARVYLSTYEDMEELIRLGAYRKGSNPEVDQAILYYRKLEQFLKQPIHEPVSIEQGFHDLKGILQESSE